MNPIRYQAIKKGVAVWNRYARFCRYYDPAWRADHRYADLRGANLRDADLWQADLLGANLRQADLAGSYLRYADLRYTYLWGANLRDADLRNADLRNADLRNANLAGTNLRDANLRQADLRYADITDNMRGNYDIKYKIIVLPDYTCIGCQRKPSQWWISATEDDVADMADDARWWWCKHGDMVKDMIREVMG